MRLCAQSPVSGASAGTPRRATNPRTGGRPSQETAGTNPSTGQAPLFFLTLCGSSVCAFPSRVTSLRSPVRSWWHVAGRLVYGCCSRFLIDPVSFLTNGGPGQPSCTSLASRACVQRFYCEVWVLALRPSMLTFFLKYVDIQTLNFMSAPGSHRGTEGEMAIAALPRCTASSSYIRHYPFVSLYSSCTVEGAPGHNRWGVADTQHSLKSHKGGPETVPFNVQGLV